MRGTLLRHIDPVRSPESLTGHDTGGAPARLPHLAYVPLGTVGYDYASGSIQGLALIPPADFTPEARDLLLEAIYQAEIEAGREAGIQVQKAPEPPALRITLGRRGVVYLRRLREPATRQTLFPSRWTGPSSRWYTATAIALGNNPGDLHSRDPHRLAKAVDAAKRIIAADCVNLGYPEPVEVWVHKRSLLNGAPAAHRFMPFPERGNGPRRVCIHAGILFDKPVRGPLILGAGRFFGLGLCAPARESRSTP